MATIFPVRFKLSIVPSLETIIALFDSTIPGSVSRIGLLYTLVVKEFSCSSVSYTHLTLPTTPYV